MGIFVLSILAYFGFQGKNANDAIGTYRNCLIASVVSGSDLFNLRGQVFNGFMQQS